MLAHTPYDGQSKPFSVALKLLDLADWIEVDGRLASDLEEKAALFSADAANVFGAEADTVAAQAEVLDLVARHLSERFPDVYTPVIDQEDRLRAMLVTPPRAADGRQPPVRGVVLVDPAEAPLWTAAKLVQEDLVLMRRGETGWRIAAAALAFPSSWRLADKFGRDMATIHQTVPGFPGRMAEIVGRIFDNLKVDQPVWRLNWSIYADPKLHHSEPHERGRHWEGADDKLAAAAFIRVERQTLRRLPVSGDILFTIRIFVDPFGALLEHPDGRQLAARLRQQLLELNQDQLDYKGLDAERDKVAAALQRIAEAG
ncbi:MAG: DUF3445 domain-containing protein [Hyphomicrobiaceae bacterium]|nr:DUF3445 domain-containing protein [Hyphomicrobiaceae bacterium]